MGELRDRDVRFSRLAEMNRAIKNTTDPVLLRLSKGKNYVPGRGNIDPRIVFLLEAPGRNEDALRLPFIGASGALLDEMMASVDLDREQVYITNSVKWWPTHPDAGLSFGGRTRPPTREEKEACRPHLFRELSLVLTSHVVALGRGAADAILGTEGVRGKWVRSMAAPVWVLPLYHPAAGLYQRSIRKNMFEDFKAVTEGMRRAAQ